VFELLSPLSKKVKAWTHIKHEILVDHVFLSDPCQILGAPSRCFIHDERAIYLITDHLPVVAIFER